jgi:protein-tyrosine phosphatase
MLDKFIDIHDHILFGVDDGSIDMDMSIEMLTMEKAQGAEAVILTPHFVYGENRYTPEELVIRFNEFKNNDVVSGLGIDLYLGNEVYYTGGISEEIDNGNIRLLNKKDTILLEFNPITSEGEIVNGVREVYNAGYKVVLAHIERYEDLTDEGVDKLLDYDTLFQMNANYVSTLSAFSMNRKGWHRKLIKEGLISFIATDSHNMGPRRPDIHVKEIERMFPKQAEAMLLPVFYGR